MRTTYIAKKNDVTRKWYIIDATNISLGRLSTVVATILRGKNKPIFTPNVDTGDNVIVINASKIKLTGKKEQDKNYYHHSNYPGGIKSVTAGELKEKNPQRLIEMSVRKMLPIKSVLGRKQLKKLHVYSGSDYKQIAQKPEILDIKGLI